MAFHIFLSAGTKDEEPVKSHERVIAGVSEAIPFLKVPQKTRLIRRPAEADLLAMARIGFFTELLKMLSKAMLEMRYKPFRTFNMDDLVTSKLSPPLGGGDEGEGDK